MGRFGCMMGRFGQFLGIKIFGAVLVGAVLVGAVLAMGRFGIAPFLLVVITSDCAASKPSTC